MTRTAFAIALGITLLAAGSAGATRTDDVDVQAPRGQDLQAPRGYEEDSRDVQAPRDEDIEALREDDVQAPRGVQTSE
jgi:hypothetical protein